MAGPNTPAGGPSPQLSGHERRDWYRARLGQHPPAASGSDEIEVHFNSMPERYWARVTEGDLLWGLETIHGFLKLVAAPQAVPTAPFVEWRPAPQHGQTRVMLCTWDRHGLLAKAAAAFSAVRLNILQADVFTRSDHIVLDVFHVAEADERGEVSAERLQEMIFLLEGALSEPPRFASVWACSRHKFLEQVSPRHLQVEFDNDTLCDSTLLRVEAADRLGLLYDLLQALADEGVAVAEARIETEATIARDVFHVTEAEGGKIVDPARQAAIRARVKTALIVPE